MASALSAANRDTLDKLLLRHPDFPIPGITFIDILPLWREPVFLQTVLAATARAITEAHGCVDFIAGLEARGFLLCGIAALLGVPFVCVRKAGKLPGSVASRTYSLEYGTATLEVQHGAIAAGARGVLVDDLIATGGTAAAAAELIKDVGGEVVGLAVIVELAALGGAARLGLPVVSCLRL